MLLYKGRATVYLGVIYVAESLSSLLTCAVAQSYLVAGGTLAFVV